MSTLYQDHASLEEDIDNEGVNTLRPSRGNRDVAASIVTYRRIAAVLGLLSGGLVIVCIALLVALLRADDPSELNIDNGAPAEMPTEWYSWIPLHHQQTDYTCGPSSMLSLYRAYGFDSLTEEALATAMHTTSADGTNSSWMATDAWTRGFVTMTATNLTVAYLRDQLVTFQRLTVVGYQAWKWPNQTYPTDWEDGHYSVVIGFNASGIFLMDPWMEPGFYGYIANERFPAMWHYYDLAPAYGWGMTAWIPGRALNFTTRQVPNVRVTE